MYQAFKDFAGPVATVIASISAVTVTGYFAWHQKEIARKKLRLDLLDRRLEAISAGVEFYKALLSWQGTPEQEVARARFFGIVQTSSFLFNKRSGIDALLKDLNEKSVKVISFKENTENLKVNQQSFMLFFAEVQEILLRSFPDGLTRLTNAMSEYVSFHDI